MGKKIISLPYSDYIPGPAENTTYYKEIFEFLAEEFPSYELLLKSVTKSTEAITNQVSREAVYHLIQLQKKEGLNQSKNFLRGVKKAKKSKVVIEIRADFEAITRFYTLYHQLRFQKFNSIPQPFSFFATIWELFINTGNGYVYEAIVDGKLAASAIVLVHKNCAYYKFGSSDSALLASKPNNLLFATLIENLQNDGFAYLDLGLSGASEAYEGLRRWKREMGGNSYPITYWKQDPKEGIIPERSNVQSILNELTKAMIEADLDPKQTSRLSEVLYPLFA